MADDPPDRDPARGSYSPLLEAAARLATRGHYHQFRKRAPTVGAIDPTGDPLPIEAIPYVTHLIGTMTILARLGARDEVLAAALLHDYLEDVDDPEGEDHIRSIAGDEVLSLVRAVTEDKRPDRDSADTWLVRKREQIAKIALMPHDAVMIKAADLLHNLLSLSLDLRQSPDRRRIWSRFNAGVDRQLWYFEAVASAVRSRLGDHPLTNNLESAIADVQAAARGPA